jgi:hypothetical protein
MLLEIRVWGSRQWYKEVMPRLEQKEFALLEDLGWSDPETDGEFMGFYYEYRGAEPMAVKDLCSFIQELAAIIEHGEAPSVEFNIIKDR